MLAKRGKKLLAVLLSVMLVAGMLGTAAMAAEGEEIPPVSSIKIGETPYDTLADAVAQAGEGAVITISGTVEIEKILLDKSLTFRGEDGATILVKAEAQRNNTGYTHGFDIGDAAAGKTINFENLTIQAEDESVYGVLQLIWVHNTLTEARTVVNVTNCTLSNVGQGGVYRHALSFEYASGSKVYNFALTVSGCNIYTTSYGIGSGLNNGNPDVSTCELTVTDTTLTSDGSGSIYNIHAPTAFGRLDVERNSFNSVRSGGIKYIYSTSNEVYIKDNDFTGTNKEMLSGTYAIMCTTQTKDYSDDRAYSWATELSGNKLAGQNTIIAVASPVEVVWFPDGQAENAVEFNNRGDCNTTDAGTRYGISKWGGNQAFICLTDFHIADDALAFTLGDAERTSAYYYNSQTSSGAYTNAYTGFDSYFTEENPRHCAASIADWSEANAITRWTLEGIDGYLPYDTETVTDEQGNESVRTLKTITAENEIAKVVVNTATGEIQVTPKSVGTTTLTATVGGGQDGTIPNAKSDVLNITVSEPYVPPVPGYTYYNVTVNYYDLATGEKIAESYVSDSILSGSSYDVTSRRLESITVGETEYTYDSTSGDALSGTMDGNKVINLYYVADEDVEDPDVPLDPEPTLPPEPTDPEEPDVDIDDPDVPQDEAPALDDVPQTGDGNRLLLWVALTFASGAGLAGMLLGGRRRTEKK